MRSFSCRLLDRRAAKYTLKLLELTGPFLSGETIQEFYKSWHIEILHLDHLNKPIILFIDEFKYQYRSPFEVLRRYFGREDARVDLPAFPTPTFSNSIIARVVSLAASLCRYSKNAGGKSIHIVHDGPRVNVCISQNGESSLVKAVERVTLGNLINLYQEMKALSLLDIGCCQEEAYQTIPVIFPNKEVVLITAEPLESFSVSKVSSRAVSVNNYEQDGLWKDFQNSRIGFGMGESGACKVVACIMLVEADSSQNKIVPVKTRGIGDDLISRRAWNTVLSINIRRETRTARLPPTMKLDRIEIIGRSCWENQAIFNITDYDTACSMAVKNSLLKFSTKSSLQEDQSPAFVSILATLFFNILSQADPVNVQEAVDIVNCGSAAGLTAEVLTEFLSKMEINESGDDFEDHATVILENELNGDL